MNIEPLESRIAPAKLVNPTTLTYTDFDGDLVAVKSSAGAFVFTNPPSGTPFTDTFFFTSPNAIGGQVLQLIDLRQGSGYQGADLTVSVVKAGAGDGLAAIGLIFAPGIDLGIVSVMGDLGEIDCGDNDTSTPGLEMLSVRSMGRYGDVTDELIPGLRSDIEGAFAALRVAEDMREASIHVTALVNGDAKIGSISLGGSLIGGVVDGSGLIHAEGNIGPVKIGRDLIGGDGSDTGQIDADGRIGAVSIGGSVVGASGAGGGQIDSGGDVGGAMWDGWELLKPLDAEWVGAYFDPMHATIEGGNFGWQMGFRRLAPRLKMVALKDFVWEKVASGWRTRMCPLGEGMVDWPKFFSLPLSLHIEYDLPGKSKMARLESALAAGEKDLKFLRKQLDSAFGGRPPK